MQEHVHIATSQATVIGHKICVDAASYDPAHCVDTILFFRSRSCTYHAYEGVRTKPAVKNEQSVDS